MSGWGAGAKVLKLPCRVVLSGMQNMGSKWSGGRGEKLDLSEKGVVLRERWCWCGAGEVGLGRLESWGVRWVSLFVEGTVGPSGEGWSEESAWLRLWPLSCGNSDSWGAGTGIGSGWGAEGIVLSVGGRYSFALFLLSMCRLLMSVNAAFTPCCVSYLSVAASTTTSVKVM